MTTEIAQHCIKVAHRFVMSYTVKMRKPEVIH